MARSPTKSQGSQGKKNKGSRIGGDGPRLSMSKHAGLVMPVLKIHRNLKKNNYAKIIRSHASVYMAAVIEYLCAEVLEVAADVTRQSNKNRIIPRHIFLATRQDDELALLLKDVVFPESGVMPRIHQELLKKKSTPKPQSE